LKLIQQISEAEFVAEFLKAEINSPRFRDRIITALDGMDAAIIVKPDLDNKVENHLRKSILGKTRGYGLNKDLFNKFPANVVWYRALINKDELSKVMYIDYSYWNVISSYTRLPTVARHNILKNVRVFGVSNKGFIEISQIIAQGKTLPRLILVARNPKSRIVVLEGHARLTAYFLDPDWIPEPLEVIIGYSDDFQYWDLY